MGERNEIRAAKWAVLKQGRSLPHVTRRAYHLVMGLVCFSLYAWVLDRQQSLWVLFLVGGPILLFDFLRLRSARLKAFALKHFGQIMRRNEIKGLSGNSYFILGLFTVAFFFPKPIALLSVLYLAVGDPVAAFVGTRFGRVKIVGEKTLEGALANFVVSFLFSGAFGLFYLRMPATEAFILAAVGGTVSTVSELVYIYVDDNFSVPVLAAVLLSIVHFLSPLYY